MSKYELTKLSGWAFIAGAFAFLTILSNSDPLAIPGAMINTLLLAAGMSGLRARHAGSFGRSMLMLGVIGPILWCNVIPSMILMGRSGIVTVAQVEKGLWIVLFGGPAISLLGLTLFGLIALRTKPMPRMNWLPVVAGIWYPVVYLFLAWYLFTHNGEFPQESYPVIQIMFSIQFLALCVLGSILVIDTSQEMVTT